MRHPKSTSHSVRLVAFAGVALAFFIGCAPPGHVGTGSGGASGTTGTAGTSGGSAGPGSGGVQVGSAGAAGSVAGSGGRGGSGPGTGGSATGAGGTSAGGSGIAGSNAGTGGGVTGAAGGGTGGSAGTGGTGGTTPPRGPTPAMNGINFPFPQNREISARCSYPTGYLNADVMTAYATWKNDLVTSNGANGFRRVQRTSSDGVSTSTPAGSTVSEGIGYGMLIAVYMGGKDDQMLFDDLWKYSQQHLDGPNNLMNWSIASDGTGTPGKGAATDADEDIAFALLMADKQWGSAGTLNYLTLAKAQINNIWLHEIVDSKLAGPGDGWGPTNLWGDINISYFAPAYYRLFKMVDSGHDWDAVIKTSYDTIMFALTTQNGNASNGLVPAWCASNTNSSGVTTISASAPPNNIFYYQYDSCRTPFRIALDWCWNGETRAQAYLMKTSSFFGGIGAANIVDGYDLNGNRHGQFFTGSGAPTPAQQSAAFLGPAGVGAMVASSYQSFLNDSYARVATGQLKVGGAYYDESWTMLSLLMMTGNMIDYTQFQPAH